ncbi:hypothetical protein ALC152_21370 [Arcobacter sp. 15-2]|uniref:P-loop NTPase fold protein n=1 Tax=Arcobacter sp. 15-2 TaxID=3374109 RepID=UPI00399CAD47
MNINPNQHITEFLNYYCSLPTAPQYAVMLKGKWGSGKTHFINEYKNVLNENKKKYIYVSLYGVTSYDEIETKFLEVLHPKLYNKKTILAGKIAKGLLKATLKVDLDDDGKSDGSISGQVPSLNAGDLLNTKDYILIFDDLERCSIDINDLLGYINYFVEHQEYKVILLANDEKFKSEKYHEIKEKLIGKTFEVVSNTKLAYDSFIKEIEDNELFFDYKCDIINIYKQSGYYNLRVFRQVILEFDRLSNTLKLQNFREKLIKDFIKIYFILAIESRLSKYSISDIEISKQKYFKIILLNDNNSKTNENGYKLLISKYKFLDRMEYILPLNIWSDILDSSIIEIEKIINFFHDSEYYFDENIPKWKKLITFNRLLDSELPGILKSVEIDLGNKKYNLNDILQISKQLLDLQKIGLYTIDIDKLYKLLYQNIDFIFKNNFVTDDQLSEIKRYKRLSPERYDNNTFEYLELKIEKLHLQNTKLDAQNIVKYLKDEDEKLYDLISTTRVNSKYYNKAILSFIDIDKLLEVFLINKNDSAYTFGYLINDRYQDELYIPELKNEKDFLYTLKEKVIEEQQNRQGKISGYNLNEYILKPLKKAINDLQTHINNKKESKS